jgi:hypothetical protein
MKAIFVVFPYLGRYQAMALFPFILIKNKKLKEDKILQQHEYIHFKQQTELLLLPFYLLYLFFYLYNLLRYRHHDSAYSNICFEKEAYQNEHRADYLQKRKPFAFLKYL